MGMATMTPARKRRLEFNAAYSYLSNAVALAVLYRTARGWNPRVFSKHYSKSFNYLVRLARRAK